MGGLGADALAALWERLDDDRAIPIHFSQFGRDVRATVVEVGADGELVYVRDERLDMVAGAPMPVRRGDTTRPCIEFRIGLESGARLSRQDRAAAARTDSRGAAARAKLQAYDAHMARVRALEGFSIVVGLRPPSYNWVAHAPLRRGDAESASSRRGAAADPFVSDSRARIARLEQFERMAGVAFAGHAPRVARDEQGWAIGCCADPDALVARLESSDAARELLALTADGTVLKEVAPRSVAASVVLRRDRELLVEEARAVGPELLRYASWQALAGPGPKDTASVTPHIVLTRTYYHALNTMNRRLSRVADPEVEDASALGAEIEERRQDRRATLDVLPAFYRDEEEPIREAEDSISVLRKGIRRRQADHDKVPKARKADRDGEKPIRRPGKSGHALLSEMIEACKDLAVLGPELPAASKRTVRALLERAGARDRHPALRRVARVALEGF